MERSKIEKRFLNMKQEATSWVSSWKELSKFIKPTRGFFDDIPNYGKTIDTKTILNGHAMRALRILSSGMTSGLTSPSRPWFKLGISDIELQEFQPVKIWLEDIQKRMLNVFSKSNVYSLFPSIYEEVALTGTSATIIQEDFNDIIRGRTFTVGEYYLAAGADGKINAFAREHWMTVGQLVEQYTLEKCSPSTKTLWENKEVDKWVKVRHVIEPNDDRSPDKVDNLNMPYRSICWEDGSPSENILNQSGYEEFPVLAPRWDTTTTADIYGRGPGWEGLGDIKMLQKMQKDKLMALDKVVNPPVQTNANAIDVNMLPGGITRYSDTLPNAGVKPSYQINPDFNAIENSINITKDDISKTFFSDLFLMLANMDRAQITAREVAERHEEKLLMLGPVLERLEGELLKPLIERTFNIMFRNNLVPTPPKELQGADVRVDFISILAQAQKMVGTTSIEQLTGFMGILAPVAPQVLDVVDTDEAVREYGELVGVSPRIVRSKEDTEKIRSDRQKQVAQAQAQQRAQEMVAGAKTLSETKLNTGSALDAITKGAQENGGIPQIPGTEGEQL